MNKLRLCKIIPLLIFCMFFSLFVTENKVAKAAPSEPYLGQICLMPYSFAPVGWAVCDGSLISVSEYPTLFSLLGDTFGGNGTTNFALPNLPGPMPGVNYCIAMEGQYPVSGGSGGIDVLFGQIELFPYNFIPGGWARCEGQSLPVNQNQGLYGVIGNKFGGDATNFNLPDLRGTEPHEALHYCIALNGFFPSNGGYCTGGYYDFIGSINLFAGDSHFGLASGVCDGGLLNINSNTAIFSLLFISFGGDGVNNFGRPDLRGAVPNPKLTYYLQLRGVYPARP